MSGQSATSTLKEINRRSKEVEVGTGKQSGGGDSPECHPPSSKKPHSN